MNVGDTLAVGASGGADALEAAAVPSGDGYAEAEAALKAVGSAQLSGDYGKAEIQRHSQYFCGDEMTGMCLPQTPSFYRQGRRRRTSRGRRSWRRTTSAGA